MELYLLLINLVCKIQEMHLINQIKIHDIPKKNKNLFQKIFENIEKIKKSNEKEYEIIKNKEKKTVRLKLKNFSNWYNFKINAKNKTSKNKEDMETKSKMSRLKRNETMNKISKIVYEEKVNIEF